tara:strand:- start:1798 stop:2079 length:282 start_codon:yes stop_codon:yes gene_type:complete
MKIQQLMERVGNFETGRVIAYIKDGLEDLNMNFETHIMVQKLDIVKDQRFYDIPDNTVKILEVRALNHLNSKDEYRRIPRLVNKPWVPDGDNS